MPLDALPLDAVPLDAVPLDPAKPDAQNLGWPAGQGSGAPAQQAADVSRETWSGLGWPTDDSPE